MSVIKQEIRQCMSGLNKIADGRVAARFLFPASFTGFKGHFPGKPVLPGVCEIQAVIVISEELHKKEGRLKKIVLAKFFNPVSPDEEMFFEYSESMKMDKKALVKVSVSGKDKKIAKFELKISF